MSFMVSSFLLTEPTTTSTATATTTTFTTLNNNNSPNSLSSSTSSTASITAKKNVNPTIKDKKKVTSTSFESNLTVRPKESSNVIICKAINESTDKKITLNGIYKYILEHYPYFEKNESWKDTIRHNLSVNKLFVKVSRAENESGKGNYWKMNDKFYYIIEGNKLRSKPKYQMKYLNKRELVEMPGFEENKENEAEIQKQTTIMTTTTPLSSRKSADDSGMSSESFSSPESTKSFQPDQSLSQTAPVQSALNGTVPAQSGPLPAISTHLQYPYNLLNLPYSPFPPFSAPSALPLFPHSFLPGVSSLSPLSPSLFHQNFSFPQNQMLLPNFNVSSTVSNPLLAQNGLMKP